MYGEKREKMNYISRHRSLSTAKKRCQIESRKAIEPRFVIEDEPWFKVVEEADEAIYSYFQQLPICQHCQTRLLAYRQSNCKFCGELKNEAAGDAAAYRNLMTAFEETQKEGLTDKAFQGRVTELLKKATARTEKRREKKRIEEQQTKERKKERKKQTDADNSLLRANGYRWEKAEIGTEEDWAPGGYGAGIGEFSHYEWELYDPTGDRVPLSTLSDLIKKLKSER